MPVSLTPSSHTQMPPPPPPRVHPLSGYLPKIALSDLIKTDGFGQKCIEVSKTLLELFPSHPMTKLNEIFKTALLATFQRQGFEVTWDIKLGISLPSLHFSRFITRQNALTSVITLSNKYATRCFDMGVEEIERRMRLQLTERLREHRLQLIFDCNAYRPSIT